MEPSQYGGPILLGACSERDFIIQKGLQPKRNKTDKGWGAETETQVGCDFFQNY